MLSARPTGRFEELVRQGGFFADLVATQFEKPLAAGQAGTPTEPAGMSPSDCF